MTNIQADAISRVGSREVNEDAYVIKKDGRGRYLFAVADGLGGHGRGELASRAAVTAAADCFDQWDAQTPLKDFLTDAMWNAQNRVMELHREYEETNSMKTTCVLLAIDGNRAMWAHVGDSRLYWMAGNGLHRTVDHSVPQMLALQKEIKEEEIRFHPDRNKLLRAMGNEWEKPKFDVSDELILTEPTAFLLCSDGFWELIREDEMLAVYKTADSPKAWLDGMAKIVQAAGEGQEMDNNTAIAVTVVPDGASAADASDFSVSYIPQEDGADGAPAKPDKGSTVAKIVIAAVIILVLALAAFVYSKAIRGRTDNDPAESATEAVTQLSTQTEYFTEAFTTEAATAAPSYAAPATQAQTRSGSGGGYYYTQGTTAPRQTQAAQTTPR